MKLRKDFTGDLVTGDWCTGFTLMEVIVSIFILLIIVGGATAVFQISSKVWSSGKTSIQIEREGRATLDYISKQISCAIVTNWEKERPEFIGSQEEVKFVSPFSTANDASDLARIIYYLKDEELRVWLSRISEKESKSIDYSFPEKKKGSQILAFPVDEIKFIYYNGATWRDNWDSRKDKKEEGTLPKAVKIKLKLRSEKKEEGKYWEKEFSTIIYLKNS